MANMRLLVTNKRVTSGIGRKLPLYPDFSFMQAKGGQGTQTSTKDENSTEGRCRVFDDVDNPVHMERALKIQPAL